MNPSNMRAPWIFCAVVLLLTASTYAEAPMKAEAEASGAKSPVQITLRLLKKKIKAKERFWYQIELKNVGKKRFPVISEVFYDPFELYYNCESKYDVYLEVLGPEGKKLERAPLLMDYVDTGEDDDHQTNTPPTPKEKAWLLKRNELVAKGVPEPDLTLAMLEFNRELNEKERRAKPIGFWLYPGKSTATVASSFPGHGERTDRARRPPIGPFTEMWEYEFKQPGRYKIRAGYNLLPGKASRRYSKHPDPIRIKVETKYIEVEVAP